MLVTLLFITIGCIIIWRSSHGFEVASDYLGRKLPPGIKGATLNAIASSMPEFLTTIFFLFYLKSAEGFSGGLGVTSGSALFNLLIIPAVVVLMLFSIGKGRNIILNKRVLLREGIVLLISQFVFVSFLFMGDLRASHGLVLVLIYMLYLGLLFAITKRSKTADPGFELPRARNSRNLLIRILTLDIANIIHRRKEFNRIKAWTMLGVSTLVMTFGTWLLVHATAHIEKKQYRQRLGLAGGEFRRVESLAAHCLVLLALCLGSHLFLLATRRACSGGDCRADGARGSCCSGRP